MNKNFNELPLVWMEMYHSMGKHMCSLMTLNMQMMNKMGSLDGAQKLMNAKQPADFTKAQANLISEVNKEMADYQQKMVGLVSESQQEFVKKISELACKAQCSGSKEAA